MITLIYVKNSKKREQSLVLFTSFKFQRDNVTERCVYEEYSAAKHSGKYPDCISIFVDDVLIAGVGIGLRSVNYSKDLLFKAFVIIFNREFEDVFVKCISEDKHIIDIAGLLKETERKWFEVCSASCQPYGFPVGNLLEYVEKALDKNNNVVSDD